MTDRKMVDKMIEEEGDILYREYRLAESRLDITLELHRLARKLLAESRVIPTYEDGEKDEETLVELLFITNKLVILANDYMKVNLNLK